MSARIHCNRDFPSVSRLIAKDCVKIYTKTRTKYPPYNLFLYIDQFRQVLFKYKVLISCLSCQPETYTSKRFQWESFRTPGNPAVRTTYTYNCHSDHLARFIAVIISGKKTESSPIVITLLPYLGQKVPNQAGPGEEGGGGKENRVSCTSYTNWHDNLRKYSTLIFFSRI